MAKAILADAPHPSTRESRAIQLYRTRGQDIQQIAEGVYRVPSQDGERSYDVVYSDEREECPCPDHQHRGVNCGHILCVGIYHAKHRKRPYRRPCACIDGWVFVGYIDEYGEEREASYRCRRCADKR